MTDRIEVPAHEGGVVRLFALDLTEDEAARWRDPEEGADPLARALGADPFDRQFAEVIRIADLGAMPLSTYLAEGYGIPQAQLAPLRGRLDAMAGHAAVVMSRAFGGAAQRLEVRAPLRLVARLTEAEAETPVIDLSSDSARGAVSPAPVPPPPYGARRTSPLLALIAVVLLGLVIAALLLGGGG